MNMTRTLPYAAGPASQLLAVVMIYYVGSVRVLAVQHDQRLELIKQHMEKYRNCSRVKAVLLHISITGIKICSPDGTVVHMAHALKRISYATSDLQYNQFCFLAREPKGHYSNQFCHLFIASSSHQAEELNSIVGNAFRMAYASQLKNKSNNDKRSPFKDNKNTLSTRSQVMAGKNSENCDSRSNLVYSDHYFNKPKPNSIPGLRVFENNSCSPSSNQSTPTSDESNSPTELNIFKNFLDKPSIMKRVPAVNIKDILRTDDAFLPTRPTPEGCISLHKETSTPPELKCQSRINEAFAMSGLTTSISTNAPFSTVNNLHADRNERTLGCDRDQNDSTLITDDVCNSRLTFRQQFPLPKITTSCSLSKSTSPMPPPPPPMPPERDDSLVKHREENELRAAPWFQAGIPREITLEVLSQEPVGAFMVRESTTKSGCYALSLRVPKEYHSRGIAHYLIIRTNRGYKIKGFTKEFSTLTALITHHSVMQELLPCPLSLSKYNPSFTKTDSNKDFEDIDSDPDYNTLADFRKMMADLNV